MPDYTGASGGADLYTDAEPSPSAEKPHEEEKDESQAPTAEIPKALLGGKEFKPGEEVVLRVVQVNEDSVLVEYASPRDEDSQEKEPAAPPPGGPPSPMSGMMQ